MTYLDRLTRFEELLGEAKARSDADRALVSLLDDGTFDSLSRTLVVAALGDTTGQAGAAAIRGQFTDASRQFETARPHDRAAYRDLMCACLWALGKRDGPGSTDLLAEACAHASPDVRDYGLSILAAVGGDRAWDDMLAVLRARVAAKITSERRKAEVLSIIGYLARHCGRDAGRRTRLAGLLRERWARVPDAETVARRYPGVGPGGPPPAEIDFGTYVPPAPWDRPMARDPPRASRSSWVPASATREL